MTILKIKIVDREYVFNLNKEYKAELTQIPNVDMVGEQGSEIESRVLIDIKLNLQEHDHKVKIKVYNTKCSMDFQATGGSINKKFIYLSNQTVGRIYGQ